MDELTCEMARGNYGYGRWGAPYWFIGPEQGMGAHENNDLNLRVKAWIDLGRQELNDCHEFHRRILDTRWQSKHQSTWRPLILAMMTLLDRPADKSSRLDYQRRRWGALDGETCVIELSGLASPSMKEAKDTLRFLPERIRIISRRMLDHRPKLVVMYGREQKPSWNAIARSFAGSDVPPDDTESSELPRTNILEHESTILVCTPHPSRPISDGVRWLGDEYWIRLGNKLKRLNANTSAKT
jgi:hypothetical protein